MRFFDDNGLFVSNGCTIAVDSSKPAQADLAVITHAHSDHVFSSKSFEGKVLASKETVELLNGRLGKNPFGKSVCGKTPFREREIVGREYSEKFKFEDFEISLESSCHILGSAQVVLESEKRVVVTSDFQLQDSLMLPKAEVQKADVLVIESTFGKPEYAFPERHKVYEEIGKWVGDNARQGRFTVLAGYSLGKAQELTKIVNEFSAEIPVVHEKVFEFNKAYEKLGAKIGEFEKLNDNLKDFNVAILPPTLICKDFLQALSISTGKKVCAGVATGWSFYSNAFNKVFALSDHADFQQLMHYVQESEAKRVLTTHGFAKEFARHLKRKLGINAMPLGSKGQKSIQDFLD